MPQDYTRRRRITRRVTNGVLVGAFSVGVAWFMTRQPSGGAFSIPQSGQTGQQTAPVSETSASPRGTGSIGYKLQAGPYAVGEAPDTLLRDAKRNRDVHIRVLYPNPAGRYPVIIFSGDAACCDAQLRHWSSYGYVVVQVQVGGEGFGVHRDNTVVETVRLRRGKRSTRKDSTVWENYPLDISLVIDSLMELQNNIPQIRRKPDAEHIGVAGQGMGAFAAEVLAGSVIDLPGHPRTNLADPRVRAVLCISPQGPGRFGLTERSFEQLVLPYLGIAGSRADGANVNNAAWYRTPFERSQAGDKYELSFPEADAGVIRARPTSSRGLSADAGGSDSVSDYTDSAALAFWDTYLRHDLIARRYLQSDALERSSQGAVKIERR